MLIIVRCMVVFNQFSYRNLHRLPTKCCFAFMLAVFQAYDLFKSGAKHGHIGTHLLQVVYKMLKFFYSSHFLQPFGYHKNLDRLTDLV